MRHALALPAAAAANNQQPACWALLLLLLLLLNVPDSEPVVIAPAAPVSSISSTHTIASVTCTQQPSSKSKG
jgi:hypothetical protein